MSRSLNVNVAPGSRSVGLSLGCARPRPVPCTPSNEPGPQTLLILLPTEQLHPFLLMNWTPAASMSGPPIH